MEPINTGHEQTVTFVEDTSEQYVAVPSVYDELRSIDMDDTLPLSSFFERPIKLISYEWVPMGPALHQALNPWTRFFENPRIINRLANYKNLQAKLHVKFTITGTPFHFGRAIASYQPLHLQDDMTFARSTFSEDLVSASQRPHVMLDPSTCEGGEIELPFLWPYNSLDITLAAWRNMGVFNIAQLNPLRHINGLVSPITITVFAWATDVVLSGPTQSNPLGLLPQSEYSLRPVSTLATSVAAAARRFVRAPIIGPYAKATEIGSTAVASIATLFGFSKPPDLTATRVVPKASPGMAVTIGLDDVSKLTVDPKQELSIDPAIMGLGNTDELEILSISKRESFLTTFDWSATRVPGEHLFNSIVDPMLFRTSPPNVPSSPDVEMHLTPMAFACLPFQYWRGSLIFRFQVITSSFHRGKICVVFDPDKTKAADPELNIAYSTIIDISEQPDFEICVGWAQPQSYREHLGLATLTGNMYSTTPLTYSSSLNPEGNGTLSVYVVNSLTMPNTAGGDYVSVNVWVRSGDDFEVAAPSAHPLSFMRYRSSTNINPGNYASPGAAQILSTIPEETSVLEDTPLFERKNFLPEVELPVDIDFEPEAFSPQSEVNCVGVDSTFSSKIHDIHFGEAIRSFRPLLKRYNLVEAQKFRTPATAPHGNSIYTLIQRPSMPIEPGFAPYSNATSTVPILSVGSPTIRYTYAQMTLMRYLTSAFVCYRGSTRWKAVFGQNCTSSYSINSAGTTVMSRHHEGTPLNSVNSLPHGTGDLAFYSTYLFDDVSGHGGVDVNSTLVNPVQTIEVPFYSASRFAYGKRLTDFTTTYYKRPITDQMWKWRNVYTNLASANGTSNNFHVTTYCAAGEDFTLGMFTSVPLMYFVGDVSGGVPVPA